MNKHFRPLLPIRHTVPLLCSFLGSSLMLLALLSLGSCEKLEVPGNGLTPEHEQTPAQAEESSGTLPPTTTDSDTIASTPHTREDTIRYVQSHGYEESPFRVSDFKTYLPAYFAYLGGIKSMHDICVCGYIVGYIKDSHISHTVFSAGQIETNIVLADSPDEKDYNNCIPIQLTNDSPHSRGTREALNLLAHPKNLRRKVLVCGIATTYMRTLGIKSACDYDFPQ